ncbi:ErmCL family antibiotic resistance leader peptide [Staphylococcus aureus]|nr:ErmCL family antibiotic resistance leader peptide [Staphylococcus aureus]HEK6315897.1 erythromycin resistance leader peptide [Staphylococcus aureus]HEK6317268.1 erythromycin resistance leader peptide [Staphylococcus aureus]
MHQYRSSRNYFISFIMKKWKGDKSMGTFSIFVINKVIKINWL